MAQYHPRWGREAIPGSINSPKLPRCVAQFLQSAEVSGRAGVFMTRAHMMGEVERENARESSHLCTSVTTVRDTTCYNPLTHY